MSGNLSNTIPPVLKPDVINTAVLFLIFNRIELTKRVLQAISQAQPPRLYIACDGARSHKNGEAETVTALRNYVMSHIDWECDVKTLFQEENLGCKYAVSSAITWFFENEEQGMILEDDCLPNQSFFTFCEELLNRYKDDESICQISGTNALNGKIFTDNDYYFSRFNNPVWGWASWRRAWKRYDIEMLRWSDSEGRAWLNKMMDDKYQTRYWANALRNTKSGLIDTWDYQWTFNCLSENLLVVIPSLNLVSNIGFGPDATHTNSLNSHVSQYANMDVFDFKTILKHPDKVERCVNSDSYIQNTWFTTGTILQRIVNKMKRFRKSFKYN